MISSTNSDNTRKLILHVVICIFFGLAICSVSTGIQANDAEEKQADSIINVFETTHGITAWLTTTCDTISITCYKYFINEINTNENYAFILRVFAKWHLDPFKGSALGFYDYGILFRSTQTAQVGLVGWPEGYQNGVYIVALTPISSEHVVNKNTHSIVRAKVIAVLNAEPMDLSIAINQALYSKAKQRSFETRERLRQLQEADQFRLGVCC